MNKYVIKAAQALHKTKPKPSLLMMVLAWFYEVLGGCERCTQME